MILSNIAYRLETVSVCLIYVRIATRPQNRYFAYFRKLYYFFDAPAVIFAYNAVGAFSNCIVLSTWKKHTKNILFLTLPANIEDSVAYLIN